MAKLIGTDPNQVPTNGDLGDLAYQNKESVTIEKATLSSDGDNPLTLNRDTSDGSIVTLQKDGSTVGSIASQLSGGLEVGGNGYLVLSATTGTHEATVESNKLRPASDNTKDLGKTDRRWKDLYLSGGVYLGGTTSANYLDDYEEGDWTPVVANGDWSVGTIYKCKYVKIGSQVTLTAYFAITKGTTGNQVVIGGMPFSTATNGYATGILDVGKGGAKGSTVRAGSNTTQIQTLYNSENISTTRVDLPSNFVDNYLIFTLTYQTN